MKTNYRIDLHIEGANVADVVRKIKAINSAILDGMPEGVTIRVIDPDEMEDE